MSDSEELQARVGDEIDIESLIALGAAHGFEFTAEDLAQNGELSDEELDSVAGGFVDLETSSQRISPGIDAGDEYQKDLGTIRDGLDAKGAGGYSIDSYVKSILKNKMA